MTHTKTPWAVEKIFGECMIVDKNVSHIIDIGNEANAQFIVKAVNCHDELLEACKEALQLITVCHFPTVCKMIRNAIDKAEAGVR